MKRSVLHRIHVAARWLLVALLTMSLFIGWRLVRNEEARLRLADRILSKVQDETSPVFEWSGLRWPVLRQLQIESLRLLDDEGVWLELRGVRARIGFRGLINHQVSASTLHADHVILLRLPSYNRATKDASRTPSRWSYAVDDLRIARMEINEDILRVPVQASVSASCSYGAKPGGVLNLIQSSFSIHDHTVVVDSKMKWNRETFEITQLNAQTPGGPIEGSGIYDIRLRRASAHVVTRELNAAWVSGIGGQSASGQLSGEADLVYSNHYTGITWTFSGNELSHTNVSIRHLQTSGNYVWSGGRHYLYHSAWTASDLMIGRQSVTSLIVRARTEEDRLLVQIGGTVREPLEANATADVEISRTGTCYTVFIPRLEGSVAGAAITQTGPSTLRYDTNRWSVVINQIQWNSAALKLTAQKQRSLEVQGFIKHLNLSLVPERYRYMVRSGVVDANWDISGFPELTGGNITWGINDITTIDHPLQHLFPSALRGTVDLQPDRIGLTAQTHGATNLSLLATANLPCRWTESSPWLTLDQESRGMVIMHANLEPVATPYLHDWQHARGHVKAMLGVYGSWSQPAITGNLIMVDGFFEDIIHGATVRDVQLNAGIDSINSFRWSLTARDDVRGKMSVTGTYQRVEQPDFVLRAGASLTNFVFGRVFGTDLAVGGYLALNGTGTTARLTGTVDASPISLRLPPQLPPSIRSMRMVDINAPTPAKPTTRQQRELPITIDTDIRIRAIQGVRVVGKQLRTEWQGRGHITGRVPEFRLGGSINLVRGSFMFLGRRFTVTQGEIIIPSGYRLAAPVVFITAETRASGADITLRVEGSTEEPTLSLSSSPPLERNEIVARLLFGRSGDSVSPFQIAFLAYTLDLLEGGGPLLQQLDRGGRTLGFDQIDIKQSEEESGLAAVVLGKRVLDRVFVEGEIGLNNKPDVFAVEAELTPSLILRTETSPRIREGISINWRRDY